MRVGMCTLLFFSFWSGFWGWETGEGGDNGIEDAPEATPGRDQAAASCR